MVKETKQILKLRVAESLQEDAHKGIVRIDSPLMKKLNLERGDVISIFGGRETHAIVDKAYPADKGEDIIRMDEVTRKNSKTKIREQIQVKKGKILEAKKTTIAPAQQGIMVKGNPDNFKRGLLGRPISKGDIIIMGGTEQKEDIMSEDFDEDLFGEDMKDMMNQMGFGGMSEGLTQVRFVIVSTSPNKPCIITENTEIILLNKDERDDVLFSTDRVIEIANMPDLKSLIEVKGIDDLKKLTDKGPFVNKFEDKEKTIYVCLNYYLKIKK